MNEKILVPGWAGQLDSEEYAHVRETLWNSPSVRHRWGMLRKTRGARAITTSNIHKIAEHGSIESVEINRQLLLGVD